MRPIGRRLSRRRGPSFPALARALRVLFRVLSVVVALQLSGAATAAVAMGFVDESPDCCADCPAEKDGDECPPGCPSCHCSHGNVALPPAFEAPPAWIALARTDDEVAPYEASVPRAPPLSGIYRPPRATRAAV